MGSTAGWNMCLPLLLTSLLTAPVLAQVEQRTGLKAVIDLIIDIGKEYYFETNYEGQSIPSRFDCPLCDSSVYSYCSNKLLHDACCCLDPYENVRCLNS